MTCSACSSRVESCVRKLPGVKDVSVNLLKNSMSVSYDHFMADRGIRSGICPFHRYIGSCHLLPVCVGIGYTYRDYGGNGQRSHKRNLNQIGRST